MQNKNKLTLHTTLRPDGKTAPDPTKEKNAAKEKTRFAKRTRPSRVSASERLFRNTALACGLLLTVMALKNIDTPVTNKITGALLSAVSMDMNLSSSVGNLAFVQKLMPESALVFLNMTNEDQKSLPVNGEIVHSYSDKQPWTEYRTDDHAPVFSLTNGSVTACIQTEANDWTVLIQSGSETECIYAFLKSVNVKEGDTIKTGMQIGSTGINENARLYFEVRANAAPVNPDQLMES